MSRITPALIHLHMVMKEQALVEALLWVELNPCHPLAFFKIVLHYFKSMDSQLVLSCRTPDIFVFRLFQNVATFPYLQPGKSGSKNCPRLGRWHRMATKGSGHASSWRWNKAISWIAWERKVGEPFCSSYWTSNLATCSENWVAEHPYTSITIFLL